MVKCPVLNQSGEVTGILDTAYSITRRVNAQQELARRRTYLEEQVKTLSETLDRARKELGRWSGQQ
jgi:hypothetical protein